MPSPVVRLMIEYSKGNLLEAEVEALVNTVNEVGVMGKGIARQFRERYPASSAEYISAAKRGEIRVGRVFLTRNDSLVGPKWIVHFPTKRNWRNPSRLDWVRDGLVDLSRVIGENDIRSIAVPPLGCGNGGLAWDAVRVEIEKALGNLTDVRVAVYGPTADYQPVPKQRGVEELSPARALIVELVRRYSVLDLGCSNLEVHKLAWFLQRSIEQLGLPNPLKLRFAANKYGPYADNLRHLLDSLDGSYLHCRKRLSEAGPAEPIWADEPHAAAVTEYLLRDEARPYLPALDETTRIIDGFESPFGLELLATVDWLLAEGCEPTVCGVHGCLADWPGGADAGARKRELFDERLIGLALDRVRVAEARVWSRPE